MEETQIVVVGAGPAGLTLGLALAKHQIHVSTKHVSITQDVSANILQSVIFEKEAEIGDDPRGVYLAHDAVRILWDLGLGNRMDEIGHEVPHVNFHTSSFANVPYYRIDTTADVAGQTVSNGILQVQPRLERALRNAINSSSYCDLRCAHTVTGCEQVDNALIIEYAGPSKSKGSIKCSRLVGADGKRGVVRKHFLEPAAGIRQVDADYRYDGTWVASNFKITLPSPDSHPNFPLWSMGYTPEQVYDLFWPVGWHFACPPGKATATGRFGPHSARYWRHEFEQNDWSEDMDAEALLWEHITPMITRTEDLDGKHLACGAVAFPQDCIHVLRCRPFRFTHKLVNRWFDNRTVLIGDAAHVFPPFGGQGIASGVRDAHQLAWRLALLCRLPNMERELSDQILSAWAAERTSSVRDAAKSTKINEQLCNGTEPISLKFFRYLEWAVNVLSFLPKLPSPITMQERTGFKAVPDGFFAAQFGGGGRMAQIWVESNGCMPVLSDTLLRHNQAVMTLLVIGDTAALSRNVDTARAVTKSQNMPPVLLSEESIVLLSSDPIGSSTASFDADQKLTAYHDCSSDGVAGKTSVDRDNAEEFFRRLQRGTIFAIVRPDMYIYGLAKNERELQKCLEFLKNQVNI